MLNRILWAGYLTMDNGCCSVHDNSMEYFARQPKSERWRVSTHMKRNLKRKFMPRGGKQNKTKPSAPETAHYKLCENPILSSAADTGYQSSASKPYFGGTRTKFEAPVSTEDMTNNSATLAVGSLMSDTIHMFFPPLLSPELPSGAPPLEAQEENLHSASRPFRCSNSRKQDLKTMREFLV